jgi:NDP-sugar pyrophosphorylase family protein
VAVRFTHEPTPLGTGGGLLGLRHRLPPQADGRVVIANADALIDLDVAAFMQRRRPGSLASLALKSVDDVARYGAIGTDDRDRVTTFAGRITPRGPVTRERMFCGWHDVDAAALDILPAVSVDDSQDPPVVTGPESCINKEGYPKHLEAGADIFGVDVDGGVGGGFFFDVGTPERLFEANRLLLSGDVKLVALAPFARFQEREGRVFVHPSAKISDDATVVGPCVIDADAVVESGATVDAWSVLGRRVTVRRGVKVSRAVVQGARGDAPHVVSDDAIAVHVGETCRMGII